MIIKVKKSLIAAIIQIEDDNVLVKIKNLLNINDQVDFWDQLSPKDQEAINEGIRQLDEGKGIPFEKAKVLIRERFNFLY